jgi:peroxiredoxin
MKRTATTMMLAASLMLVAAPFGAMASVGTRAPEFALPAAPGGPSRGRFRLADHVGQRPVVVLFWATWCQPCLAELPVYQAAYARYNGRLMVVAISLDGPDSVAEAGPLARNLGLTFPVVTDLDTQVTNMYNQRRAAPFSVWIDRQGVIVREREGFSLSERGVIDRGLAQLVAGQPVR